MCPAMLQSVVRPSVCLSLPCPCLNNGAFYGCGYCRTLIGNPVVKVEPTGQPEVASATLEAFTRWLQNRHAAFAWYAPIKLPSAEGECISFCRRLGNTLYEI